jgi:hypothetical protein
MKNMSISNPYEMMFSGYKVIYILFPDLNSQDLFAKCMPMNNPPPPLPSPIPLQILFDHFEASNSVAKAVMGLAVSIIIIIIIYFQSALNNIILQTKYSVTWPHHGIIFLTLIYPFTYSF